MSTQIRKSTDTSDAEGTTAGGAVRGGGGICGACPDEPEVVISSTGLQLQMWPLMLHTTCKCARSFTFRAYQRPDKAVPDLPAPGSAHGARYTIRLPVHADPTTAVPASGVAQADLSLRMTQSSLSAFLALLSLLIPGILPLPVSLSPNAHSVLSFSLSSCPPSQGLAPSLCHVLSASYLSPRST